MLKNQEIILEITDYTAEGSGVGKYEGMAVFVPETAVGDTIKALILKVKKTYAFGKALEIIKPSSNRCSCDCGVFSKCGGCAFRHINYEAEKTFKESKVYEAVKRIGGVDMKPQPIIYDKDLRYRNKVQYPVNFDGKAGFYAFHSHRIVPINDCLLQPIEFKGIISVIENWIKKNNVSVYNEENGKGLIRHIFIRKAEKTNEIMVALVINSDDISQKDELINELLKENSNIKSIGLNINKNRTNVILGNLSKTIYGEDYIIDILCGIKVRLSLLSFYQVNRDMAEKLYNKAREYAKLENKTVHDHYCGAGTIGLSMAREAKNIIGVEIIPEAVKDAEFNAKNNGIKNARFICGDAAKAAEKLAEENIKTDVVIVDPPRKGCSEELIKTIAYKFSPDRVVYVSCDPATLARDIKIFSDNGYVLKEYTPADLFPRTSHVETVALLKRCFNNESPYGELS